jgi:hypothetical protein
MADFAVWECEARLAELRAERQAGWDSFASAISRAERDLDHARVKAQAVSDLEEQITSLDGEITALAEPVVKPEEERERKRLEKLRERARLADELAKLREKK